MRRRGPPAHGVLERDELALAGRGGQVRECGRVDAVLEVGSEERASLGVVRIARGVKHVWGGAVVVGRPLVEVVRDVEGGRVRGSVLEVDDDDL